MKKHFTIYYLTFFFLLLISCSSSHEKYILKNYVNVLDKFYYETIAKNNYDEMKFMFIEERNENGLPLYGLIENPLEYNNEGYAQWRISKNVNSIIKEIKKSKINYGKLKNYQVIRYKHRSVWDYGIESIKFEIKVEYKYVSTIDKIEIGYYETNKFENIKIITYSSNIK